MSDSDSVRCSKLQADMRSMSSSTLQALPEELHVEIYQSLSYIDVIRLCQTSKYFHKLIDPQTWPKDYKAAFVHKLEVSPSRNLAMMDPYRPHHFTIVRDDYACFHCYRVLPKSSSSTSLSSRKVGKSSESHNCMTQTRFCIDCGLKTGRYREGTQITVTNRQQRSYVSRRPKVIDMDMEFVVCGQCAQFSEEDCGYRLHVFAFEAWADDISLSSGRFDAKSFLSNGCQWGEVDADLSKVGWKDLCQVRRSPECVADQPVRVEGEDRPAWDMARKQRWLRCSAARDEVEQILEDSFPCLFAEWNLGIACSRSLDANTFLGLLMSS